MNGQVDIVTRPNAQSALPVVSNINTFGRPPREICEDLARALAEGADTEGTVEAELEPLATPFLKSSGEALTLLVRLVEKN